MNIKRTIYKCTDKKWKNYCNQLLDLEVCQISCYFFILQVELQNLPSTSGCKSSTDLTTQSSTDQPSKSSTSPCYESCIKPERLSTNQSIKPSTSTKTPSAEPLVDPSTLGGPSANQSTKPSTSTKVPVKPKPYHLRPKPKSKVAAKNDFASGPTAMADLAQFIKTRKSGKINGFHQDYEVKRTRKKT